MLFFFLFFFVYVFMFVCAGLGVSEDTYVPQHVWGGPTTTVSCSSLCPLYEVESLLCVTADTRLAGWRAMHIHCLHIWLYVGFESSSSGPHASATSILLT